MPEYGAPVTDPALLQQLGGVPQYGPPVDPTTAKFLDQVPSNGEATVKTGPPSLMTDIARGVRDPFDQLKALFANAPGIRSLLPQMAENVARANAQGESDYRQETTGGPLSTGLRMGGNIAATAPLAFAMPGAGAASLLPRMASGLASGAATGALEPVTANSPDFWQKTAENAGIGGIAGAAAPAALSAIARGVNPNAAARIAPLTERGVTPTMGQAAGGVLGSVEEKLSSLPGVGDFIRSGRRRAVDQFNEGAINDALAPIGQKLEGGAIGRDAIAQMSDKIGEAYKSAVPEAGGVLTKDAIDGIQKLWMNSKLMRGSNPQDFENLLKQNVLDRIAPNGGITGQSFQEADENLGKYVRSNLYGHNTTPESREIGGAARELQSILRNWLADVNPQAGEALGNARSSFARALRIENASTRGNSMEPGQFTPSQLTAAVKKYSSDKQFSTGRAPGQEYAEAGKNVLGDKIPDSGTPGRFLTGLLFTGAAGGALPEPFGAHALGLAGLGLGAAGLYSKPGQAMASYLFARRPDLASPIAGAVRGLAPAGSAIAPWMFGAVSPQ